MAPATAHSPTYPLTPLTQLWLAQCLEASAPVSRLQLSWLKTMDDIVECEVDFMFICMNSCIRMSECLLKPGALHDKASLESCYQDILSDVTEASFARFDKVAELSHEFRQQLWEEI